MEPSNVHLYCLPEQAPIQTILTVSPGWSLSRNDECLYVSGYNERDGEQSEVVDRSYPDDCIPLPEPNVALGLAIGFLAASAHTTWKRRRDERAWKRSCERAVQGVRLHGQRQEVRGRLREMLRRIVRLVGER